MSDEYRVPKCWFATHVTGIGPCDGPMDRAHWIPKQRIRREFHHLDHDDLQALIWHPSVWTWACRRHHGNFDNGSLRIKREMVPEHTERYAMEFDLVWSLDATFGPRLDIGETTSDDGGW